MKQLVVFFDRLSKGRIAEELNAESHLLDLGQNELPKDQAQVKSNFSPTESNALQQEMLNKLNNLGDQLLVEELKFNGSSVFYYHKFRVYYSLLDIRQKIDKVKSYLSGYDRVKIVTYSSFLNVYFKEEIKVEVSVLPAPKRSLISWSNFTYLLTFGFRAFVGMFQYRRLRKKRPILLDRSEHYEENMMSADGSIKRQHPNITPVAIRLDKSCLVIDEIPLYGLKGAQRFKSSSKYWQNAFSGNMLCGEYIMLKPVFGSSIKRKVDKEVQRMSSVLKSYLTQEENQDADILFIIDQYLKLNGTTKVYLVKELSYSRIFKKYPPISVTASDENAIANRTVLNAARQNQVKTIGIQHGAIGITSPNYMYSNVDQGYNPVPSVTLVWGDYWRNLLIESGCYKSDQVKVVGQIRTDVIKLLKSRRPEKAKKTVLFASQPIPDQSYRERAFKDLIQTAFIHPEINFVVKPHPREYDIHRFEEEVRNNGCKNIRFKKRSDLYQLLSEVDLLLTCYSTVAIEALYFDLPVVLIDYNKRDMLGFGAKNIAPMCGSSDEISRQLSNHLADNYSPNKNATEYVSHFVFKIDGNVISRVIEEIVSGIG